MKLNHPYSNKGKINNIYWLISLNAVYLGFKI